MNIKIIWKLKNNIQSALVTIDILERNKKIISKKAIVDNNSVTELHIDDDFLCHEYIIKFSRLEPLRSGATTLDTWVIIDKIIIDEFWEFNENNFQSYSYYDKNYYRDAQKNGATWELEKDRFNNVLFFSGSIEHKITIPARNMFWH